LRARPHGGKDAEKAVSEADTVDRDSMAKKNTYPISCAAAANLLGCHKATIQRAVKKLGCGVVVGQTIALSEADMEAIRGVVRDGPGNPNFGKSSNCQRQICGGEDVKIKA
jgi:hypothetical protein